MNKSRQTDLGAKIPEGPAAYHAVAVPLMIASAPGSGTATPGK